MYIQNHQPDDKVIHHLSSIKYTEAAQKACLHYHRKAQTAQLNNSQYAAFVATIAESLQLAASKCPEIESLTPLEFEQVALGLTKQFMDALDIADKLKNIVNPSTGAQIAIDRAKRRPQDVISNVVNAIIPCDATLMATQKIVHDGQLAKPPVETDEPTN